MKVESKEKEQEKSQIVKQVDKKKASKNNNSQKDEEKHKTNISSIVVITISIIFIIIGIILSLIGGGIINFNRNRGSVLYSLTEKLKVGDYVNYDAGIWDNTKEVPNRSLAFSFGGYTKDTSRNDGVICNYNYIKNKGWRVFKIKDNTVTLIQSGLSMCYYHGYGNNTNDKSLKILNGEDEKNNFNYFLNDDFASSVSILSKDDIDEFNGNFSGYKRLENDLIKIGVPYWLATKSGSYYMWYVTEGGIVATDHVGNYGVRILVTLKNNIKTTGQDKNKIWQLVKEEKKEKKEK